MSYTSVCNLPLWYKLLHWLTNNLWLSTTSSYHKTKEDIERELVQIKKAQDNPQDFAPIYNRYYNEIFVYISKRIENLDIVADVTSKTFTNCLVNLHKFKFMGVPFSAWLYKIAINEVRLFFRARKTYPRSISISETEFRELQVETTEETTYQDAYKVLPELLGHLSEIELQMIELRFFEKKSFKEIGFIIGLTEVNAKVKTYRILKKLKDIALNK